VIDHSTRNETTAWQDDLLSAIARGDDLLLAPVRPEGGPRGGVPGTPTWMWSVAVGEITSGGRTHRVDSTPADPAALPRVPHRAYSDKYGSSPYLPAMLGDGPRAATLRVSPAR
jgi:hypothetical protein